MSSEKEISVIQEKCREISVIQGKVQGKSVSYAGKSVSYEKV